MRSAIEQLRSKYLLTDITPNIGEMMEASG
jgi:hypothetical protein